MPKLLKPSFSFKSALGSLTQPIEVLDVGAMLEGEACYAGLLEEGLGRVTGFEPNAIERARLVSEGPENCTWLPYFLGTGEEATFHLTRYPGCSSLYEPDPEVIDLFHSIGAADPGGNFYVESTERVSTHRLDDVEECPQIDFIKLDVQGAELDILRHGVDTLKDTLVVQSEVEFVALYKNQPLFGDLQVFMREQGFQLHKLIDVAGRCVRPFELAHSPFAAMSQVLWADAIFVRDFRTLGDLSELALLKAAAILHEVYLSYDVVLFILKELDSRGGGDFSSRYSHALQRFPPTARQFMNLKENID